MTITALLAASAACSKSADKGNGTSSPAPKEAKPSATSASGTTPAAKPLVERLEAAAGNKPGVFYTSDKGVGFFVPGKAPTKLTGDPAWAGAYDAAAQLLWYATGGKLVVLDLREHAPAPRAIVTGVPEDIKIVIVHGRTKRRVVVGEHMENHYLLLAWGGAHTLQARAEAPSRADPGLMAKAKKASLVGAKWLEAQVGRRLVTLPKRKRKRDSSSDADFGTGTYKLHVLTVNCEDGPDACEEGCVILDPKTGKVTPPLADTSWVNRDDYVEQPSPCDGFVFDVTKKHYIRYGESKLCTTGGKCRQLPGSGAGMVAEGTAASL